jgi:hypothetical protein
MSKPGRGACTPPLSSTQDENAGIDALTHSPVLPGPRRSLK